MTTIFFFRFVNFLSEFSLPLPFLKLPITANYGRAYSRIYS